MLKNMIEQGLENLYLKAQQQKRIRTSFSFLTHELKAPLRMISGFLSLIQKRLKKYFAQDPELPEMIQYAVDGALYLRDILKHLKQYGELKVHPEEMKPTDLNHTLSLVHKNLEHSIRQSSARFNLSPLPTLKVHSAFITELFQNLISNALKYRKMDTPPEIRISAHEIGSDFLFEVSDNGIGIDPQHRERIFEMFQRLHTREEYQGIGLGLSLCKRIVEAHGGKIWVESDPGNGATFCFTLPA
jgi:light-regulated signal transduction histidine kinase (bacteriophytochrome)